MIISILRKKEFIKKIYSFIYYLRYLILIFIFSIILLFTTPKIFNYVDKIEDINDKLKNQHGFIITNSDEIKYKIFPLPNLKIKNSYISFGKNFSNIRVKELKIFTNFRGLYSSKDVLLKQIKFKGNFLGYDFNGYYTPQENLNLLFFQVKSLGIESKVFLNNKKKFPVISGTMKSKVTNDNLITNFDYDKNLRFKNSVYKNKNIYTNFSGKVNFEPFFYFKIFANVKKIDLNNLELKKLYQLIVGEISNKQLNGDIDINFLTKKKIGKSKSISQKVSMSFNNGDIILKDSIFQFANLKIQINSYLKKYSLYNDLDYKLLIETEDINKFFKTINLKNNKRIEKIKVSISGNINLDAQKFYFDEIKINKKSIEEKKLIKLKDYLDKNITYYLNTDFNEKNIYLFLKNLIEFI